MSATVSVRVSVDTRDKLAAHAARRGISLSQAITDVMVEAWWSDAVRQEARAQSIEWQDAAQRAEIEELLDASHGDVLEHL